MGPVKNPPSPQSDQRKDYMSTVSEDMAPAAKSRRLLNSCLTENQKVCLSEISPQMEGLDEKKIEEANNASLDIPYLTENNENAVDNAKKPANLNSVSGTAMSVSLSPGDLIKGSSEVTKLTDLSIFESNLGSNGEKMENGAVHLSSEDHRSIENHNSNTSSAPEDMSSPPEVKEKVQSLSDWTKDLISSSLELSSSVTDTLSEMLSDSSKLCLDTTKQFANTYFTQTASSVDKIIEQHVSSQGGQSFNQSSSVRRHCSSVERDHKFFDSYLKPHLKALKTEFEVDSDATEESSDEEMSFPSGAGHMTSGNESSPLPQSPASTISDFSTFSTSADLPQFPSHPHVVVEKTFPAERNYLRRRSDIHSMWVWLAVKYKGHKRQLKKLNQLYRHYQRTTCMQNSQTNNRRREQLTRSSSPESTLTLFTGPPTPLSSEASATDAEASASCVGTDDASMTSARVRPYVSDRITSGLSPTRPHTSRSILRPCALTSTNILDLVLGPSSVQCHCQYPEVYPCILCCGNHVDRELNPSAAAKSTRMQLPPAEKIYPRHKLDLSFHEKLSRSSDMCHSLSYDEAFVSRRPRLLFISHSQSKHPSPASYSSQRQQSQHSEQLVSPMQSKHQSQEQYQQQKHPQQLHHSKQRQQHPQQSPHQRLGSDEFPSESHLKSNAKRLEQVLSNGDIPGGHQTSEDPHRQGNDSCRVMTHSPFMRRKRGRRKQHPYSRSSAQHPGTYYNNARGEHNYSDTMHGDDNHRQTSNFCKQRLGQQMQQHSHPRSAYRTQPNQQWHHQQRHSQPVHPQHQYEQQSQYRHRHHHPQQHYHQQQRQNSAQSRRGAHHAGPHAHSNRLSHNSQLLQSDREEEQHMQSQQYRAQFNQQKMTGNRQHCLSNQQHGPRSKVKPNFEVPKSAEPSVPLSSSHSLQARSDSNHSHPGVGMRSLVVNIATTANSNDIISSKDHPHPSVDTQCSLVRRPSTCTTVPVASRRPVSVSKMGFISRGSSIPDEDTASVSSSGGSVKSMRSVCSSRLEVRRRSEENSMGLRSLSVVSESLRPSDNKPQTDIETPLWRRLPAGISAAPEEAAVMHLLSVGAVGSVRDREVSDATAADSLNSKEFKSVKKTSDVTTPYHLVMLDDHQSLKGIEDTSDIVYLQRHKAGEVTERSTNVTSNIGSNSRQNSMEELCLQPGELLDQVRR